MGGRLRPNSSCGSCRLTLGKLLGSFQFFRHATSSLESMDITVVGDSTIRQCLCMIFEMAPYRRRRCCIPDGRG